MLRCCIIACIDKIKILNGGKIKGREKLDSEIYYLKNLFHEFFRHHHVD